MAIAAAALCYLALTRDYASDQTATDPISQETSSASSSPTDPAASPSQSTEPVSGPPVVKDQRRVDFSAGDDLPDGAVTYDGGGNASPLRIRDGALTHGPPEGNDAIGVLEVELGSDVQEVSATVRFADPESGWFALVASPDSVVAAATSGAPLPTAGLRLIVTLDRWMLVVNAGGSDDEVLDEGTWQTVDGAATFLMVRQGTQLWVVDPSGPVGHVDDLRVGELSGPWAGWALSESAGQTPVSIVGLSAG